MLSSAAWSVMELANSRYRFVRSSISTQRSHTMELPGQGAGAPEVPSSPVDAESRAVMKINLSAGNPSGNGEAR
jgi:hypothetical protein